MNRAKWFWVVVVLFGLEGTLQADCRPMQDGLQGGCARQHALDEGCRTPGHDDLFGFTDGSCYSAIDRDLTAAILSLKPGDTLPRWVYLSYRTEEIAEALSFRRFSRDLPLLAGAFREPKVELYNELRIVMAFRPQYIDSILKNGFLNLHQIGQSGGENAPESRARAEDYLAGVRLEKSYNPDRRSAVNELRPKYAYAAPMTPDTSGRIGPTTFGPMYGNAFAVFKDRVKNRSTFTPGDSLGRGAVYTFRHFSGDPIPVERFQGSWLYMEAQIWGRLTIEDVDYFVINCPSFAPVDPGFQDSVRPFGVAVYSCKTVERAGVIVQVLPDQRLN